MSAKRKKFRSQDVHNVYKTAYNEDFQWDKILPNVIKNYFSALHKGAGCPIQFVMAAMLAVVASMCGPLSKIECHPNSQQSSLNLFFLAVSAPGGGKSATFDQIITPAAEIFLKDTGKNFLLENYTHAGMQNHQGECKGMGLIASDEGIRVMSSIESKQQKNEGERQFLCKTWTGKGDYTVLKEKERGYPATSTSILLFVQPQPFMGELRNFECNDGLLDRFLILAAMPFWFMSNIIAENAKILKDLYQNIVTKVFQLIYNHHKKEGEVYKFSDDAQIYYNKICDDFAAEFNKQYEKGDLQSTPLQCSQEEVNIVTSKDPVYIARLSACFHILIRALVAVLRNEEWIPNPNVSLQAVKSAHMFYNTCLRQKFIFWQAVNQTSLSTHEILGAIESTRDRVLRTAYKMRGPLVQPREIHKLLKGITAEETKCELERLASEGYGKLERRGVNGCRRDMFYKSSPSTLRADDPCWDICHANLDVYTLKFNDYSTTSPHDYALLPRHPQYVDLPLTDTPSSMGSLPDSQISTVESTQDVSSQARQHSSSSTNSEGIVENAKNNSSPSTSNSPTTPQTSLLSQSKTNRSDRSSFRISNLLKPSTSKVATETVKQSTKNDEPLREKSISPNFEIDPLMVSPETTQKSPSLLNSSIIEESQSAQSIPKLRIASLDLSPIQYKGLSKERFHNDEAHFDIDFNTTTATPKEGNTQEVMNKETEQESDSDSPIPSYQPRSETHKATPPLTQGSTSSGNLPATLKVNRNDYGSPYKYFPDSYFKVAKRREHGVTGPARGNVAKKSATHPKPKMHETIVTKTAIEKEGSNVHVIEKDIEITTNLDLEKSFMEVVVEKEKPHGACTEKVNIVNNEAGVQETSDEDLEKSFMITNNDKENEKEKNPQNIEMSESVEAAQASPPMTSSQYRNKLRGRGDKRKSISTTDSNAKSVSKKQKVIPCSSNSRSRNICMKVRNALIKKK